MTQTPTRLLLPALLVTALALTGCSGGGGEDDSGGSSSVAADAPAAERQGNQLVDGDNVDSIASKPDEGSRAEPVVAEQQALIRKGSIALQADDVGQAQIDVQKVVDRHSGQVTDENSQSDKDGEPTYTRMVLRIPSDEFDEAVGELKAIGKLEDAKTKQEDVTTQVIDVQTRLRVQKRSIARITVLFQQATSIRDIMAIESELSQRQADLDALEQQAAYLADQTSMSTIAVSIDRTPDKKAAAAEDEDDAGFVAGLKAGWGALSTFAVGLATALGALLPWLVVVLIVGIPTLLLVRALRRRTPQSSG
ncbi:DUF4349 domain-containing protein [Nocardioides conyzicola]|uniref:DUF4349 domain-containing protein n=1 Tax=Nocardioides conyzicola TaxID=1651781 RepID=A0ABP8X1A9_9ACTN